MLLRLILAELLILLELLLLNVLVRLERRDLVLLLIIEMLLLATHLLLLRVVEDGEVHLLTWVRFFLFIFCQDRLIWLCEVRRLVLRR